MKFLIFTGIWIVTLWLQLSVAPLIDFYGYKPNLFLLTVVVIGMRNLDRWLFFYAMAAGLAFDVFSHGMLGIYGISFFAVFFLARFTGQTVYENNLLFGVAGVFGLTVVEELISISLLQILDPSVPWLTWVFRDIFPIAAYNGLLAPPALLATGRLERFLHASGG